MELPTIFSSILIILFMFQVMAENCDVCINTVGRFAQSLTNDQLKDTKKIENSFKEFCKGTINKEQRLCYYLGGLESSATGILAELSRPLSWSMPAEKICNKLQKKDVQICELRYDVQIDINAVDIKKLKVKELKKILNDWNTDCEGCLEKIDYIKKIESLKHKYVHNDL